MKNLKKVLIIVIPIIIVLVLLFTIGIVVVVGSIIANNAKNNENIDISNYSENNTKNKPDHKIYKYVKVTSSNSSSLIYASRTIFDDPSTVSYGNDTYKPCLIAEFDTETGKATKVTFYAFFLDYSNYEWVDKAIDKYNNSTSDYKKYYTNVQKGRVDEHVTYLSVSVDPQCRQYDQYIQSYIVESQNIEKYKDSVYYSRLYNYSTPPRCESGENYFEESLEGFRVEWSDEEIRAFGKNNSTSSSSTNSINTNITNTIDSSNSTTNTTNITNTTSSTSSSNSNTSTNYTKYEVGNQISIVKNGKEEVFYVIEPSGSNESTVTLIAKYNINELGNGQLQSTNATIAFASEKYWANSNTTGQIDINKVSGNGQGDAMTIAQIYAKYIGGESAKGRLLTEKEAKDLKDNNHSDVLYSSGNDYWLASTYLDYYYYIEYIANSTKSIEFENYNVGNKCSIRPVITIDKSVIK